MERRKFTQLLSLTGLSLLSSNYILGGIFNNLPPDQQDFILTCGINADPSSIKPSGIHLRWCLPPAKGFPDKITIYRRPVSKDQMLPIFTPSPANIDYLKQLCDQKSNKGWVIVGTIDNKKDFIDAQNIYARLKMLDPVNAFLPALPTAAREQRFTYYNNLSIKYVQLCKALKNPQINDFKLPNNITSVSQIPINELEFKSHSENESVIKPWNLLALAAIDPNIAVMLGFYFVDKTVPVPGAYYDYKIEAHYEKTNNFICGVVRQVSNEYSLLPTLNNNLIATQIGETSWKGDPNYLNMKQVGNVRLSWKSPVIDNNNLRSRHTDTVLYLLQSIGTKTRRIVPTPDNLQLTFTDREVPISSINYQINGVDIFGQKSNTLSSTCAVKNKSLPAPPIRLSFLESGSTLQLQFEYGGSQYLHAPDIKKFKVYQRNDTVMDSLKATFTLSGETGQVENGDFEYSILLNGNNDLAGFEYMHFVQALNNKKLRASDRKKFRIRSNVGNRVYFTCSIPNYTPPTNGWVLLSKSPGTKSASWLNVREIDSKAPVIGSIANNVAYTHFVSGTNDNPHFAGTMITAVNAFNCRAAHSTIAVEEKDLFESDDSQSPSNYTEILLNRSLLIADIFSKGKVKINNIVYPIEYQSAGIATPTNIQSILTDDPKKKNKYARIIIKDSITISANTSIQLVPPIVASTSTTSNKMDGYVVLQTFFHNSSALQSAGEILLTANSIILVGGKETEIKTNAIARVCSDFYTNGSQKEVLVHIDKKIKSLDTAIGILWFAPYQVNITTIVKDPALPLLVSEAHKSAYFAIEAVDSASPEKAGPFSAIAQFIKTRSPHALPITPALPFPCGNEPATESFLNIPNKNGRSTFCIAWKDIKNAQGSSLGYRYEVGRALDKTIIAVHRDLWLKGRDYSGSNPNTLVSVSSLTITDTNTSTGLITLRFSPSENKDWSRYKGGRLKQVTTATGTRGFEITRIEVNGNTLSVMIRPMIKDTAPINAPFTIDELPNYVNILLNTETVRSLSNSCDSAFSVVTGQPLRNTTKLLDDVPGTGSSRFFYKVRSVDASENRSIWSPASVAVWQMDTTLPDVIREFKSISLNKKAFLYWKKPFENITEYYIIRKRFRDGQVTEKTINSLNIRPKPIQLFNAEILQLEKPVIISLPSTIANTNEAERAINELVSLFEIVGIEKQLVKKELYKISSGFDAIKKKAIVDKITFLSKRHAGNYYEIQVNGQAINSEPEYVFMLDETVTDKEKYTYELKPVKCVGPISRPLKIPGVAAISNDVEIKDYSKLTDINASLSFLSLTGTPQNAFAENTRSRITITKPQKEMSVRILRKTNQVPEINVYTQFMDELTDTMYNDWIIVPKTLTTLRLLDTKMNVDNNFKYVVEIKSELGIFNTPFILAG